MPREQLHSTPKGDRWSLVVVKPAFAVAVRFPRPVAEDGGIRERPPRPPMLYCAAQAIVGRASLLSADAQEAVVPKQQFKTIVVVDRWHVPDPAVPRNAGTGSAFHNSYEFEVRCDGRAPDYRSSLLDDVVIAWRIVRRGA